MAKPTQPLQPKKPRKKQAKRSPRKELPEDTPLTAQQERFVCEYIVDFSPGKAGLRAGYASEAVGRHLLTKAHIRAAIRIKQNELLKGPTITRERILQEVARIAMSDPRNIAKIKTMRMEDGTPITQNMIFTDTDELHEDDSRTIAEMSMADTAFGKNIKIKQHDKVKALALLMQHFGMLEKGKEATPPEEHAKQIRDALDGIDEAVAGE